MWREDQHRTRPRAEAHAENYTVQNEQQIVLLSLIHLGKEKQKNLPLAALVFMLLNLMPDPEREFGVGKFHKGAPIS